MVETPRRQDAKRLWHEEPAVEVDALAATAVDCAFAVHKSLGPGYLEAVYEKALAVEFASRGVRFKRQAAFDLSYRGHRVGLGRVDFIVESQLIIEAKAVELLHRVHSMQLHSYLLALDLPLGLLINFNVPVIKSGIKRVINGQISLASWRLGV